MSVVGADVGVNSMQRKPSAAPSVLYVCTAVGTLLSGLLPLADGGGDKLFDIGVLYILPLVVPSILLVLAAVQLMDLRTWRRNASVLLLIAALLLPLYVPAGA